ncbi:MAG: histidine kinase [Lachnospiraceae bacterium]|nr:histidine kinase [Lachnospiraceae bacterium]
MKPSVCFYISHVVGFSLMFSLWIQSGEATGFFLSLFLVVMTLFRFRLPNWKMTVFVDIASCLLLAFLWDMPLYILVFPLFSAMYFGVYWALLAMIYLVFDFQPLLIVVLLLSCLSGFFLGRWEMERQERWQLRDQSANKYYELENLQNDLTIALEQVERMTVVAERTRIARDIHDNAGHEIIASYISLQTIRNLLEHEDAEVLELYDSALERLDAGVDKIRESVHNFSAVTALGVDALAEICQRFPACKVNFHVHGDTLKIPIYVWNVLEACLNESLTNVGKHAQATYVKVDLDATPHIVRLCVENDGVSGFSDTSENKKELPIRRGETLGNGLRNIRYRVSATGGNLSVDVGNTFRVICVIPMKSMEVG